MRPTPVPIVRMFPLKDTDLIPQPEFREGIFLTAWSVLESRRSVLALLPTAYVWHSSSVAMHTFSKVWGNFLDMTCFIRRAFQQ